MVAPACTYRGTPVGDAFLPTNVKRLSRPPAEAPSSSLPDCVYLLILSSVTSDHDSQFKNQTWPLDSGKKDRMKAKVTVFSFLYRSVSDCTLILFSTSKILLGALFAPPL